MFDYDKRSSILLSILAIVLISYAPAHAGEVKVDKKVTLAPTGNTVAGPGIVPALPIGTTVTVYDNPLRRALVATIHCNQGDMRIFLQDPGGAPPIRNSKDAINGRTIAVGADEVARVQVRCEASGATACECIWRIDKSP